jgi:hypothetical protein
MDFDERDGVTTRPALGAPSIAELIGSARPTARIDRKARAAMIEAMRAAATRRVDEILANKRRSHYGHAAALVACCVELAPAPGKEREIADWADDLRRRHSRFYAFRQELESVLTAISARR